MSKEYNTETIARFVVSGDASGGVECSAAPAATHVLIVDTLVVACAAACTVTFTEETSGTTVLVVNLAANDTKALVFEPYLPLDTAGKKLVVTSSVSTDLQVCVMYRQRRKG